MKQSTLHPYRTRPHSANTLLRLSGPSLLLLCCLAIGALPARAELEGSENYYGAYTLDELNALEQALQAGNMTLADLQFDKDYAKGHECFPIIREMMQDPLQIASWMDEMAGKCETMPFTNVAGIQQLWDWLEPGNPSRHMGVDDKAEADYAYQNLDSYSWIEQYAKQCDSPDDIVALLRQIVDVTTIVSFSGNQSAIGYNRNPDEIERASFENLDLQLSYFPRYLAWHDIFESPVRDAGGLDDYFSSHGLSQSPERGFPAMHLIPGKR
ncbi:MAG: hypothetical protein R3F46_08765 [bacterium]